MLARYEVEKGWTITEHTGSSWYEPGEIKETDNYYQYYSQAEIDGGCFVYHMYPLDAEDVDEDFELENATTTNIKLVNRNH